jgi:hypothetical protein
VYFVYGSYRDKKVVGIFDVFRAPLHFKSYSINERSGKVPLYS